MNRLKLGAKVGLGFALVLFITSLGAGVIIFNMIVVKKSSSQLEQIFLPILNDSLKLRQSVLSIKGQMSNFDFDMGLEKKYLAEIKKETDIIQTAMTGLNTLIEEYPQELAEIKSVTEKVIPLLSSMEKESKEIERVADAMVVARQGMDENFTIVNELATRYIAARHQQASVFTAQQALKFMIESRSNIYGTLAFDDSEMHEEGVKLAAKSIGVFKQLLSQDPSQSEQIRRTIAAAELYHQYAADHVPLFGQQNMESHARWNETINSLLDHFADIQSIAIDTTEKQTSSFVVDLSMDQKILMGCTLLAIILGLIIAAFITHSITRPVKTTVNVLGQLSQSDLTVQIDSEMLDRKDELGQMLRDVQSVADNLSAAMMQINQAANTVTLSAHEISQGNHELNERTQTQASSVERTSCALEEMTKSVNINASNAEQANQVAKTAMQVAQEGNNMLDRTVAAMEDVSDVSSKINDIVRVVNEIAFQINLLSLNASVEAARAGEAGRGFAVVAGEVRTLASRTASASKEIQELIADSSNKIEQSNSLVNQSSHVLRQIIESVTQVAESINNITETSREQTQAIEEINNAVAQVDQAVQQNSALVEEITAASENMTLATEQMQHQLASFNVKENTVTELHLLPAP